MASSIRPCVEPQLDAQGGRLGVGAGQRLEGRFDPALHPGRVQERVASESRLYRSSGSAMMKDSRWSAVSWVKDVIEADEMGEAPCEQFLM